MDVKPTLASQLEAAKLALSQAQKEVSNSAERYPHKSGQRSKPIPKRVQLSASGDGAEYDASTVLDASAIFDQIDTNHGGVIDRAEFSADPINSLNQSSTSFQKRHRLATLRAVFGQFDLDGSGLLETTELLELGRMRRLLGHKIGHWSEAKNLQLIQKMDTNGDGEISADEFVTHFEAALPDDTTEFALVMEQFMEVADVCRQRKQQHTMLDGGSLSLPFDAWSAAPELVSSATVDASAAFEHIDTNHDGVIDRAEFSAASLSNPANLQHEPNDNAVATSLAHNIQLSSVMLKLQGAVDRLLPYVPLNGTQGLLQSREQVRVQL